MSNNIKCKNKNKCKNCSHQCHCFIYDNILHHNSKCDKYCNKKYYVYPDDIRIMYGKIYYMKEGEELKEIYKVQIDDQMIVDDKIKIAIFIPDKNICTCKICNCGKNTNIKNTTNTNNTNNTTNTTNMINTSIMTNTIKDINHDCCNLF